jgi:tetratricopeptide (TPR) repeat protein
MLISYINSMVPRILLNLQKLKKNMKNIIIICLILNSVMVFSQRETAEKYKIQGTEYAKSGNFEKALELLNKSVQIDPTYAAAYNNIGSVLMQQSRYKDAIIYFTKAIEQDQSDYAFYLNRAAAKSKLQEYKFAVEDYNLAIKIAPEPMIYQKRALVKKELNDIKGAVEDMDDAIGLDDKNAELFYNRGLIKLLSEEYNDGQKDVFKAAELGYNKAQILIADVFFDVIPDDKIFALQTKAGSKFYAKDYAGAEKDLTTLLNLQPNNGKAYMLRGLSRVYQDEKDMGCQDLQKAINLGVKEAEVHHAAYCKE